MMVKPLQTFSIRRRVLAIAVVLLALAAIVLVVFLRDYAQGASNRAFDRLLAASALSVAGSVHIEEGRVIAELPFAAMAMLSGDERVFYTVRDIHGHVVTGYGDLDDKLPLATAAAATFSDNRYRGEGVRVATVGRLVSASGQTGWVTIRVAETRGARDALAAEILNRSVIPLLVLILVALGLLWFGIKHAFAPLHSIGRELRQREPNDLQPLRSPVPNEVRQLVAALNAFMQRLQGIMFTLNNLVADAAHQIRTPLASLRAQADVALDETDPERLQARLLRIHANATHASQLVNQFLMDAAITHRLGMRKRTAVSVVEIINDTRRRIAPDDSHRLRIRIAPEVRRARVQGDRLALREMLRNVVDNAMRYAPDSLVYVVAVRLPGGRLSLTVSDRGPGLSAAEKRVVLQRFQRASTAGQQPGSGLGMAIVAAVIQGHDGTLALGDSPGGGLRVSISLPLTASSLRRTKAASTVACSLVVLLTSFVGAAPYAQAQLERSSTDSDIVATAHFPARSAEAPILVVAGPTDVPLFTPLAHGFQQAYPDVAIEYREIGSSELYQHAVTGKLADADVLISSAVDMQMRLANDGYALSHQSQYTQNLPSWAVWRSEVFGFTFEPVVMVYNTRRFTAETAPRSRRELLELLEARTASFRQRVGTYDIAASSVGHLLATLDEQVSSNFWGLMNAFGQVGVELDVSTGAILDKVERGELDLGYNVLGSYALNRQATDRHIGVAIPEDYVLVLARAALITRTTQQPALAGHFVDWLLSPAGQRTVNKQAGLGAIMSPDQPDAGPQSFLDMQHGTAQPVALRPVLLVGLDQQRKARFLKNWIRLVTDTPAQ